MIHRDAAGSLTSMEHCNKIMKRLMNSMPGSPRELFKVPPYGLVHAQVVWHASDLSASMPEEHAFLTSPIERALMKLQRPMFDKLAVRQSQQIFFINARGHHVSKHVIVDTCGSTIVQQFPFPFCCTKRSKLPSPLSAELRAPQRTGHCQLCLPRPMRLGGCF